MRGITIGMIGKNDLSKGIKRYGFAAITIHTCADTFFFVAYHQQQKTTIINFAN
jgi:hypothetical protein